ncbi:MAG: hypothetical protein G3H99_05950, partial [Ferrovum sp.]|nr:hypothetical protein [Ferrovum sp.]
MTEEVWEEAQEHDAGDRPPGKVRRQLHLWVAAALGGAVILGFGAQALIGRVQAHSTAEHAPDADALVLGQAPAASQLQQELVREQLADPGPVPSQGEVSTTKAQQEAAEKLRQEQWAREQQQAQIAASPILAIAAPQSQPVPMAASSTGSVASTLPEAHTGDSASGAPTLGLGVNGVSSGAALGLPANLVNSLPTPW